MKKYLLTALIPFTVATASELDELKKTTTRTTTDNPAAPRKS